MCVLSICSYSGVAANAGQNFWVSEVASVSVHPKEKRHLGIASVDPGFFKPCIRAIKVPTGSTQVSVQGNCFSWQSKHSLRNLVWARQWNLPAPVAVFLIGLLGWNFAVVKRSESPFCSLAFVGRQTNTSQHQHMSFWWDAHKTNTLRKVHIRNGKLLVSLWSTKLDERSLFSISAPERFFSGATFVGQPSFQPSVYHHVAVVCDKCILHPFICNHL